jgi:type II secretory pathway component PulJ
MTRAANMFLSERSGMTLIELTVVLALTAFLLLGLIQIVSAAGVAIRLQDSQVQTQDHARYAFETLAGAIRQAGFSPEPWNDDYDIPALTTDTLDSVSPSSDRLAIRSWSDLNCFNNRNPMEGTDDRPLFYIKESIFDLNSSENLTHLCRYGPSTSELTTQIRRQGLIPGVESFQVLFGEDNNDDGNIDRWVRAGQWGDQHQVLGARIGLLLAGSGAVTESSAKEYSILDSRFVSHSDGRLRQVFQFSAAIRGRAG